ncbi:pentatricopeptide repeat-containing protein At5g39680-like [Tasmannia lanceolata]|uniref:pentatricopeptide repeat-containing protein At5g39680-like n=1 Tax=Tasmannia lanceolata TaxID=3420 RepID=UPI00406437B2
MQTHKSISDGYALLLKNAPFLFKFKPSNTFVSTKTNVKFGQMIHAHLIRTTQTDSNLIQNNTLVNLYAKCGRISLARRLFDEMSERNVVSWSTLMAGYFHKGLSSEVLSLFVSMNNGFSPRPNEYIFATVISSCANLQAFEVGIQCHAYVLKSGLVFYSYVMNALIYMYSRCSDVEGALRVFKTMPRVDSFSCNSLIYGLIEHKYFNEALEVLNKMGNESVAWDHVTYTTILGLCACMKDLNLGLQVHGQILRKYVEFNVYVGSAIIDMYGKCGRIVSARNVFDRLVGPNVVSWTAIMSAYSQNGGFEEALKLFVEMELDGVRANEFTYAVMLNSCAGLSALRYGDLLNAHIEKMGFKAHLIVGNALINLYSKSGSVDDAGRIFEGMLYRDVVSWNSMIAGYAHHGFDSEALEVFRHMLIVGEVPNYVTFVGVLSACGHLGLVSDGFYYLNNLMKDIGITPGVEHYTCIVGLLGRAGLLDEAEKFMRCTPVDWDVVAWRTLLSACHVHQNFGLGKRIAEIILQLDPVDVGTYILLSNMYAKAKRWDGVVKIRKLMRGRDIKKEPGVSWIQVKGDTHVFVSEDRKHPDSRRIYEKLTELLTKIKLVGYVPDFATVLHDVDDEQKEEYLRYHSEKLAIAFGLISMPPGAPIHIIKNLRMCEDCHMAAKLISNVTNRKIVIRDANRFHCFESGFCSCGDYW